MLAGAIFTHTTAIAATASQNAEGGLTLRLLRNSRDNPDMDKIEIIKTMFAANAEAIRIRDEEWREWLSKALDPVELNAAESMYAPPDRED